MMVLAVLLLHPVLDDDGALRLVAAGVGDEDVVWSVDGAEVARTGDRDAVLVQLEAGAHEVKAASAATGAWQAMARPDGPMPGVAYVPAWTAQHEGGPDGPPAVGWRVPGVPLVLALAAAVLFAWPRRTKGP